MSNGAAYYSYDFSENVYLYTSGAFSLEGSAAHEVDFAEQIDISESVVVEALTETEIEIVEGIELVDELVFGIPDTELCFPYGGTTHTPTIVLQSARQVYGIPEGGDALQWYWPDPLVWETQHSYTLSWERGEMQPAFAWEYIEDCRQEPVRMESGVVRLFHSKVYPVFDLTVEAHFCDQQFLAFLIEYALSWIQNTPRDGSEYRRILFYPTGTGWIRNRFGQDVVAGIPAYFEGFLKPERIRGNYGAYRTPIRLISAIHMDHDTWLDYVTWSPIDPE